MLALVIASRFEPTAHDRTSGRDACAVTTSLALIHVSKRVEVPAPDGRKHAKEIKHLALIPRAFALQEPNREHACERVWHVATDHIAEPAVRRSARAPPG